VFADRVAENAGAVAVDDQDLFCGLPVVVVQKGLETLDGLFDRVAAEIDALNTLASVACACCVLECGFGPTKRRWAWGGFAALSMAALLLLKGPAGMPVVGGAIIGGSIATQKWAWAKRPSVWVSLVIGIGIFAAWVLAAALTITTENLNPDDSGPNEVYNRLTPDDIGHLLTAAGMPFTLIGYSMPWSIAVLLGFVPSVTRSMEEFAFRVRARAAMGTVVAAFVICGIALMTRPRYGYVALPMVCLAVAAIAEAWYRGWFSAGLRAMLRQVMTVTVVLLAGLYGVLMYLSVEEGSDRMAWLIGGAVVGGGLLLLGVGAWVMQKHRPGAWAVAGLIVVASIGFNEYKHLDRDARSGLRLGQQLREQIGVDEAIVAEKTVLDHPEVFYYGKLDATRYLGGLEEAFQRKEPAWFIMHKDEWEEWKGKVGTRMINVKPIDDPIADWQIGWYLGEPATLEIQ